MRSKINVLGWIIFLLAVLLFKLEFLKNGVISADPARDLGTAYKIVEGASYPLIGPLLGGHLHVGPLFFYVLALPLFISQTLLTVLVFVSLFQIVGIIYCFFWGKLFFNEKIGYILSCLMSIDLLSNFTLWQVNSTDFIFPLGVAFNYHLSRTILKKESRHLLIANVLFIVAVQFHPLFLVFLPLFIYAHVLVNDHRKKILTLSILILIGVMTPWCYHQIHYGFPALRESVNFTRWEIIPIPSLKTLISIPEFMLKQIFWNPYIFWGLSQRVPFSIKYGGTALLLLISFYTLFGTARGLIEVLKNRNTRFVLIFGYILLLWFTIPFLRNFTAWYYFAPVQFMWMALAAYGSMTLMEKAKVFNRGHFQKAFWVGLILVIGLCQQHIFHAFTEQGYFRVPLNTALSIIDLRKPFVKGEKDLDFIYLGVLKQEALANWAASASKTGKFHGAILYELSLSRNALYNVHRTGGEQNQDSTRPEHYVGILKKDFAAYSRKLNIVQEIGAMRILKVTSLMEDSTAKASYMEREGWFMPEFDDNHWAPLSLPVYTIQDPVEYPPVKKQHWDEETIFLRMHIRSNAENNSVMLGVGFPSWDPLEDREQIESAYLNGVPLMNFKKTGHGWFTPLTCSLTRGEDNLLALKLRLNKTSDLDVYLW